MNKAHELLTSFKARFGTGASVYRAPGRVNLIGEHTDYNEGFVLPAAIGFSCWVGIAPRSDRKLIVYSENFREAHETTWDALAARGSGHWWDYPLGVAWALQEAGYRLRGADIYIAGDVPLGAGLSSSAAIEVSTGYALLSAAGHAVDRTTLALLCQRAENEFVGMRCGIMDQFVSCHGQAGHALMIDCRSLEYRVLRLPAQVRLVICNTMVKHKLQAGEYNVRRAECEEAVPKLSNAVPTIRSLRDVSLEQLSQNQSLLSETLFRRCRHIVSENERVRQVAELFEQGKTQGLWELMAASHQSMRDDYEISCRELDAMVEIATRQRGVYGARMTGGGFGGCTINFVDVEHAPEFQRRVSAEYESAIGLRPDIYICEASQGAELVETTAENLPKVTR
ncbi:MAG: galactokinase [Candidatus Acidoferrum typicum]|nr:galactokinase [Candidatus Acidoferrum typicum]